VLALVALALVVRLAFLAIDTHPYTSSGLAAASGEIARQVVDHGRWFEADTGALRRISELQNAQHRLIDPADVDFSAADADPHLRPEVLQPVGEGVVLAGLWAITGDHSYIWLQLLQILIDAGMVAAVFWIGATLYNRRAGLIGAGLYALFPPIAAIAAIPHLDIWGVDFTIAVVALALRAVQGDRQWRWAAAAGVVAGLGAYFRPGVLLVAGVVALATWAVADRRRALATTGLVVAFAALMLVPWTIRNADEFGEFIPTRIGIGQNLWEGLGEQPNDFGALLDDQATERQVLAQHPDLRYGTPEFDAVLREWATDAIKDHPGFYAELVARRAVNSTLLLRNTEWAGDVPALSAAGPVDLAVLALEPLVFLLGLLGVALTWARRRRHLVGAAVIAATIAPYLLLHQEPRYILPASFVYLVWIGVLADRLLARRAGLP
jgi:4-amino-4-deoxy-L-arabinose transferase-like glycosyltransferase